MSSAPVDDAAREGFLISFLVGQLSMHSYVPIAQIAAERASSVNAVNKAPSKLRRLLVDCTGRAEVFPCEVVRDNMHNGPITPQTVATHDAEKSHKDDAFVWPIRSTALRPSRNGITAEGHQYSAKSTDLLFSLELLPEYHPSGRTAP